MKFALGADRARDRPPIKTLISGAAGSRDWRVSEQLAEQKQI